MSSPRFLSIFCLSIIFLPSCDDESGAAERTAAAAERTAAAAEKEAAAAERTAAAAERTAATEKAAIEKKAAEKEAAGNKSKVYGGIDLTKVRLRFAALKLEEYANDNNGLYPVGEDTNSSILYLALSGDYSGEGKAPTGPVYWKELLANDPSLVGVEGGRRVILDGFSQSLRYRSALDENGEVVPNVKNDASFDLWSVGPDGIDGTPDDIWVSH